MKSPGEILLQDYLKPLGISQNAMARAMGVPPRAVNEIVLGRRAITPAMSIRFGAFFGQPDNFWSGLQMEADFRALDDDRRRLTASVRSASELRTAKTPSPTTSPIPPSEKPHPSPNFFQLPVENL
ncbi:MAG: HigA family addiction module antitoxin [Terrimicrobiaceae bacterium]